MEILDTFLRQHEISSQIEQVIKNWSVVGDYRNYYKGHMDKIKGEGGGGGVKKN